ncbi:MAG TPA: hypothetical protein GX724_02735 [Fibrobacter sp.]|nr:hypothetical protein [Fibrobacter sp.]
MNKKALFSLLFGSLFLFACSGTPTKAEILAESCEGGLSAKCLEGTWALNGLYTKDDFATPEFQYNPPSTIKFNLDGSFEYNFTTDPNYIDKHCPDPQAGLWRIEQSVLVLKPMGDCLEMKETMLAVSIDKTTLNFNTRLFHDTEVLGVGVAIPLVEIYTRK